MRPFPTVTVATPTRKAPYGLLLVLRLLRFAVCTVLNIHRQRVPAARQIRPTNRDHCSNAQSAVRPAVTAAAVAIGSPQQQSAGINAGDCLPFEHSEQ